MLDKKERIFSCLLFLLMAILIAVDIHEDFESGASLSHIIKEAFIVLLALAGFILLLVKFFKSKKLYKDAQVSLEQSRIDLVQYRQKIKILSQGISEQIDSQMQTWSLSTAEKEIALLSLKGLSNIEISNIRNTSDATTRQQMTSILKKSNLKSRSELSAFFLEDLLVRA